MNIAQFSNFAKELRYCRNAPSSLRSSAVLFLQTVKFHIANKFKLRGDGDRPFCISLRIAEGYATKLYLRPLRGDLFILYEVLMSRCYAISSRRLDPSSVEFIIDCGANIGITSLFFASRYPNAKILSIEPHPENFALLQRNVAAEPRIVPIHAAIVGTPQSHVYITSENKAWGNTITREASGFKVPAVTLAELMERFRLEKVDLLKIDIEGAEKDVFRNGGFLSRVKLGLIELHGDYDEDKFADDLTRYGHLPIRPGTDAGIQMMGFEQAANSLV